jgi:hypothetical protein
VCCTDLLPFDEPEFIQRSILPSDGGEAHRERYFRMKEKLKDPIRFMPDDLGRYRPESIRSSAAISGCSTRRSHGVSITRGSSAFGTDPVPMAPEGPSTCTTK